MTERRRTLTTGFTSGLIAGVFMLLLMLAFRYFMGTPSLAELMLDCVTPFLPIPIFFGMLNAFGGGLISNAIWKGVPLAYPQGVRRMEGVRALVRLDAPIQGKVAVVTGGRQGAAG